MEQLRDNIFAGKVGEEGSRDGTLTYCHFYEASEIDVEFGKVVYVYYWRPGSVKMITILNKTVNFIYALQSLVIAFPIHEKHKNYRLHTLNEAI